METLKIQFEVNINLSESAQRFIQSLLSRMTVSTIVPQEQPVRAHNDAQAASSIEPLADDAPFVGVELVRAELAKKVNDHREAIKAKLNELGAPSVTKLNPDYYSEMYNFLVNL